jgi:hypothetical protein
MDKFTNFLQNTLDNFIAIMKVMLKAKSTKEIAKLNVEGNKEVFILANGPSLKTDIENKDLLSKFKNSDVLVVNFFSNSPVFYEIKPKYLLLVAIDFLEDNPQKEFVEQIDQWIESLLKVDWEINIFIPYGAKKSVKWQEKLSQNDNVKIVFINYLTIDGSKGLKLFFMKKKLAVPRLHNVLGPSIMTMIWCGYKNINLYGVDHSWLPLLHVDDQNRVFVGQPHFYGESENSKEMGTSKKYRKLHEVLDKFLLTFKGYFDIKEFAEKQDIKIINYTKDSFIDAFEKR